MVQLFENEKIKKLNMRLEFKAISLGWCNALALVLYCLLVYFFISDMGKPIRLKDALKKMDERDPLGQLMPFQVAFYTVPSRNIKHFKRVSLPLAIGCNLPRPHRHKKNLIGLRPTTHGHDYTVNKKLIVELNHSPVIP